MRNGQFGNPLISVDSLVHQPGKEDRRLLFEAGSDGGEAFRQGHIPGALYFDTSTIEEGPRWNRVTDSELAVRLPNLGLDKDSNVLIYGRSSSAAARVALILMYSGVQKVSVLDGGWQAWLHAGGPVETGNNPPLPKESFGAAIPDNPDFILDMPEIQNLLKTGSGTLVSVRSWEEFTGKTSGYDFIQARGRIAGAVWGHGGDNKDSMSDFHNPDGTARALSDIETRWLASGIAPDKRVVFYCGTGWRASEAFLYARALGWPRIAVYDGGWLEWSADPDNPTATGDPGA